MPYSFVEIFIHEKIVRELFCETTVIAGLIKSHSLEM